jgi:hypothetical protein|tara:strand:+ start:1017 stop:1280 length:264 start_codon:yes stop_codon:yes gene_type:complete
MKNHINYKSSTNEGSKSVNTFGVNQVLKLHSGSSICSSKSLNSLISGSNDKKKLVQVKVGKDANSGVGSEVEDVQSSSKSLFANSMS